MDLCPYLLESTKKASDLLVLDIKLISGRGCIQEPRSLLLDSFEAVGQCYFCWRVLESPKYPAIPGGFDVSKASVLDAYSDGHSDRCEGSLNPARCFANCPFVSRIRPTLPRREELSPLISRGGPPPAVR